MANTIIQVPTAHINMTGVQFRVYASKYFDAAEVLHGQTSGETFDPIQYHLLCQSLELHLKSFIWLTDRLTRDRLRTKYGHDIVKLWRHAKERKITKYCAATRQRNETIELVGPYYKKRQFVYLDLSMSWEGIPLLREKKHVLPTLRRLCEQLHRSLRQPILRAA